MFFNSRPLTQLAHWVVFHIQNDSCVPLDKTLLVLFYSAVPQS